MPHTYAQLRAAETHGRISAAGRLAAEIQRQRDHADETIRDLRAQLGTVRRDRTRLVHENMSLKRRINSLLGREAR